MYLPCICLVDRTIIKIYFLKPWLCEINEPFASFDLNSRCVCIAKKPFMYKRGVVFEFYGGLQAHFASNMGKISKYYQSISFDCFAV